mgnify:CR=1 FL=1
MVRVLGEGTFGQVVLLDGIPELADWPRGKKVACKIIKHKDEESLEDARKECTLMSHFGEHPGLRRIVPGLYHVEHTRACSRIYMEFFDISMQQYLVGDTAKKFVHTQHDSAANRALARQLILGMQAFHAAKVLHRDVKPNNILIHPETGRLVYADWGLGRHSANKAQNTRYWYFTTPYRSLEVLNGEQYGSEADVFALGVVLFQLFSRGSWPWDYLDLSFTDIGQMFTIARAIGGTVQLEMWATPVVGNKRARTPTPPQWKRRLFSEYMSTSHRGPGSRSGYAKMPASLRALLDNVIAAADVRLTIDQVCGSDFVDEAPIEPVPLC